jgi:hypothetical protein
MVGLTLLSREGAVTYSARTGWPVSTERRPNIYPRLEGSQRSRSDWQVTPMPPNAAGQC